MKKMQGVQEINIGHPDNRPDDALVFRHHQPGGPLAKFVDLFWYWQKPDLLQGLECVLPTGTVELVIDLDSCRAADTIISGVKSKPVVISATKNCNKSDRLLGIHFKPGGAFPFLPFPLYELHNHDITLGDLWGDQQADRLLSLIHESDTITKKFNILEQWLLVNMRQPLQHHPAVSLAALALQALPNISMKALVEKANLSQRYFIQLFQKEMGFTPKLFSRITRFQTVLDTIEKTGSVDWFDIAATYGYYDQSHFIHEFQEFSGITPTLYLDIRTEHRNHIPIIM